MASDIYLKVGELFAKWLKMRIAERANKMSGFVARDLSGFIVGQEVTEYETDRMATEEKHFYTWYRREGGGRSYSWVKNTLQRAGLVTRQ
jgi:hypothetical protein